MNRQIYFQLDDNDDALRGDLERLPGFAGVLPSFKPGERHRGTLNALLAKDAVAEERIVEFMHALDDLSMQIEAAMDLIPQVKRDRERQIDLCQEINVRLYESMKKTTEVAA